MNSINSENSVTYKQGMSSQELSGYFKAVAVPIGVFLLVVFAVSRFGAYGNQIIAPAASAMWIIGAIVAFKIPAQRRSTLKETMISVAGYCAGLLLIKWLIGIAANTSSEQLMASFSQPMPAGTGSTISGFLQSMLWILSFMTPITVCGMQAKKLVTFQKTMSKNKVLDQIRGIRDQQRR